MSNLHERVGYIAMTSYPNLDATRLFAASVVHPTGRHRKRDVCACMMTTDEQFSLALSTTAPLKEGDHLAATRRAG